MFEAISNVALVSGVAAVAAPTIMAAHNVVRLLRTTGDHLIVIVGDRKFVLDVGALEHMDVQSIDSATKAVEKKAEVHA